MLRRMRDQVDNGAVPTNELIDAALVFAGGVLLFVPGFVTGAFGLLLLFPPARDRGARAALKRRFRGRVYRLGPGGPARAVRARRRHRRVAIGRRRAQSSGRRSSGTTGQSERAAASPRALHAARSGDAVDAGDRELLDRDASSSKSSAPRTSRGGRRRRGGRAARARRRRSPRPRAPPCPSVSSASTVPAGTRQCSGPIAAAGTRKRGTSVSVGSHGSTMRTPRSLDAPPQRRRGIGALDAQRDRGDVEPLDQREVDRLGPADHRDDLLVVEQRQRRAQPVGGAVGSRGAATPRARRDRGIGRGEDPRAHPPQRTARAVVREHPPARDHEARGLGREPGRARRRLRSRAGPRRPAAG